MHRQCSQAYTARSQEPSRRCATASSSGTPLTCTRPYALNRRTCHAVNGWIGRAVLGPSSFSGSSLRARSRANSAEHELSVGASIRLDWSRVSQLRGTVQHGAAVSVRPRLHAGPIRHLCGVLNIRWGGGLMKEVFYNLCQSIHTTCSLSNVLASPTLPWRGPRSFITVPGT